MKKLAILSFLFSSSGLAATDYVEYAIHKAAKTQGVPHKLLRAICMVESGLKAQALNTSDGGLGKHAFGLCQLLYTTAAELGVHDERCLNIDWDYEKRIYHNCKLWGPYTNANAAAKFLAKKLKKYDNLEEAIAAYNSGKPRTCPKKGYYTNYKKTIKFKCVPGDLMNRNYVTKVQKALDRIETKWDTIQEAINRGYEKYGKK